MLEQLTSYATHLLVSMILLALFIWVYTKLTPHDEFKLIRGGNTAAVFSMGGPLLGFCLTLASSLMHNDSLAKFLIWALLAMVVQIITFVVVERAFPRASQHIESNNTAMGAFVGATSLAVGIVNAACLS